MVVQWKCVLPPDDELLAYKHNIVSTVSTHRLLSIPVDLLFH